MKALFALMVLSSIATGIFAYSVVSAEPSIKVLAQSQDAVNLADEPTKLGDFYMICAKWNAAIKKNNFDPQWADVQNLAQLLMRAQCIKNKNLTVSGDVKFKCIKKSTGWSAPTNSAQQTAFNAALNKLKKAANKKKNQGKSKSTTYWKNAIKTTSTKPNRCQAFYENWDVIFFNFKQKGH